MNTAVWRIATDTPNYQADDLSGLSAETTGGRWNEQGIPIIYASANRALACLETIVHFNAGGLPFNRYLVEIRIPRSVWNKARIETPASLPVGWEAAPAGAVSIGLGTDWARHANCAILLVPSVIVPEEMNVLINPLHPESTTITASKQRRWLYDPRLGIA